MKKHRFSILTIVIILIAALFSFYLGFLKGTKNEYDRNKITENITLEENSSVSPNKKAEGAYELILSKIEEGNKYAIENDLEPIRIDNFSK